MAILSIAGPRRRLSSLTASIVSAAQSLIEPHRASLSTLRDIPLTVAGTGSIDFAAFHLAHGWGWLVTGISLILLEHVIAEDGR